MLIASYHCRACFHSDIVAAKGETMAEEKVVEEHEYKRTETDESTSESHRDTVTERDATGKPEVIVEHERTVEKRD
jgi:hypothetical protein